MQHHCWFQGNTNTMSIGGSLLLGTHKRPCEARSHRPCYPDEHHREKCFQIQTFQTATFHRWWSCEAIFKREVYRRRYSLRRQRPIEEFSASDIKMPKGCLVEIIACSGCVVGICHQQDSVSNLTKWNSYAYERSWYYFYILPFYNSPMRSRSGLCTIRGVDYR